MHGAGWPRCVYRSKFEASAALLQLCLCTACQVGPDHEVMKRPDRVEIGEAQGIVDMHNGCRDEQRACWRMASEQRQSEVEVSVIRTEHNFVLALPVHREEVHPVKAVPGRPDCIGGLDAKGPDHG